MIKGDKTQQYDNEMKMSVLINHNASKFVSQRKIVGGNHSNVMKFIPIKYPFAVDFYNQIAARTSTAVDYNLSKDKQTFGSITELEKKIVEKILCSVNLNESLLFSNYQILLPYITAPEISLAMSSMIGVHAYHTYIYSNIYKRIFSDGDAEMVYELWRTNNELRTRNSEMNLKFIEFNNKPTNGNFLRNIVLSLLMEKTVMYSDYSLIYAMARKGKMVGTARIFRKMNNDISLNVSFLTSMYNELTKENPELVTPEFNNSITVLVRDVVNIETDFIQAVAEDNLPGLSNLMLAKFTQSLANDILKHIGLSTLYPGISTNPLPWFQPFLKER